MSATNEYLPPTSDTIPNGNGNGHGKIFSLKPATDPDTLLILNARQSAMAEPNHRLNRSAKACFVEILDKSLHPGFFDAKGVVTLSDSYLAGVFSVSNRSVFTWKRMIEAAGYVWTSQKWKSNMWPLTTYHVSCLHKKPPLGKTDADGTYGGGKLRPAPERPLGCRQPGQPVLPLPGSRSAPPEAKSDGLQGISALEGNFLPARTEEIFGSEPKETSGENRSQLPARTEEIFGSEPKESSGENRRNLPARTEATCEHLETQVEVVAVEIPIFKRLGNRAKDAGTNRPKKRLRTDTEEFLSLVREVCGAAEAENNSGLWVTNLHADPGLAFETMNETRSAKVEKRIKTTPAKHAMDYWKRRWREKHPNESVVAAAERRRSQP